MKVTAGLIITDGLKLVMGHSTGNKHWDIPKGRLDENETELEAVIREVQEETGLIITPDDVTPLGRKPYNKDRELSLFLMVVENLPDPETLICSSMVNWENHDPFPELDKFKLVAWKDVEKYAIPRLADRIMSELPKIMVKIAF